MTVELKGKVALVTGAGGGLGAAICRCLAEASTSLIVSDMDIERAQRVAGEIRSCGLRAEALQLDVRDECAAVEAVAETVERFGRVDILINNAGTDVTQPIDQLSIEDWDRVLDVNLRGPFVLSKAVLPLMAERRQGHIVNIVSTAAKRAWANATAYHASKWGLLGFSHALHVEARPFGVKVTAVISGGMRTPFILDRFPETPLDVLQAPENVAETVRFILSQPAETVIPEVMVLPMKETSWP